MDSKTSNTVQQGASSNATEPNLHSSFGNIITPLNEAAAPTSANPTIEPLPSSAADRIPRSAKSIAFALDQLEKDLESSEDEEDSESFDNDNDDDIHAAGLLLFKDNGGQLSHRGRTSLTTTPRPKGITPRGEINNENDEDEEEKKFLTIEEAMARRAAAADAIESHPLEFISVYPRIAIVTTASLPWLTGTAVNPALRAAYLWKAGHAVTLVIPWVAVEDQHRLFAPGVVFASPEDQAIAVIDAVQRRVPFPLPSDAARLDKQHHHTYHSFRLVFYPGRYDSGLGSIMPEVDIQPLLPQPVDLIVLEEPEHLTWYHTGKRWTRAFPRHVPVVGIMHTNYVDYAKREAGEAAAGALKRLNKFLCRQHTHKVVKLSDAVQNLPRQETCFVHGVSHTFLGVGEARSNPDVEARPVFTKGIYFLGKALWAKGFAELLDRFSEHKTLSQQHQIVDVYGKGEQLEAIKTEAALRGLPLKFLGAKDHLSPDMGVYRAFVNPSTSDVVATTTAEAMAMGKWVIVPKRPCNDFFADFANCLVYSNAEEFSNAVNKALTEDPAPLTPVERRKLTWEAATDRFLHCCASAEVGRGPPLARVAAKTGWLGFNVGHQVYNVASGVLELVRRARPPSAAPSMTDLQQELENAAASLGLGLGGSGSGGDGNGVGGGNGDSNGDGNVGGMTNEDVGSYRLNLTPS
jgi:digalactosyldiacylglycerol synthase